MATLTMTSPVATSTGSSYTQNVGRAARALLAAILAFNSGAAAPAARPAQETQRVQNEDLSLYNLYSLAAPYDIVMPNLAQELRVMASRD